MRHEIENDAEVIGVVSLEVVEPPANFRVNSTLRPREMKLERKLEPPVGPNGSRMHCGAICISLVHLRHACEGDKLRGIA